MGFFSDIIKDSHRRAAPDATRVLSSTGDGMGDAFRPDRAMADFQSPGPEPAISSWEEGAGVVLGETDASAVESSAAPSFGENSETDVEAELGSRIGERQAVSPSWSGGLPREDAQATSDSERAFRSFRRVEGVLAEGVRSASESGATARQHERDSEPRSLSSHVPFSGAAGVSTDSEPSGDSSAVRGAVDTIGRDALVRDGIPARRQAGREARAGVAAPPNLMAPTGPDEARVDETPSPLVESPVVAAVEGGSPSTAPSVISREAAGPVVNAKRANKPLLAAERSRTSDLAKASRQHSPASIPTETPVAQEASSQTNGMRATAPEQPSQAVSTHHAGRRSVPSPGAPKAESAGIEVMDQPTGVMNKPATTDPSPVARAEPRAAVATVSQPQGRWAGPRINAPSTRTPPEPQVRIGQVDIMIVHQAAEGAGNAKTHKTRDGRRSNLASRLYLRNL